MICEAFGLARLPQITDLENVQNHAHVTASPLKQRNEDHKRALAQVYRKSSAADPEVSLSDQRPCTISVRNQARRSVWSIQTSIKLAVATSLFLSQVW